MREIYRSRDERDYLERVLLLDEKLNPELVLRTRSSDEIEDRNIYHLSNGVTLLRIIRAYSGGSEFSMTAFGNKRNVGRVEKLIKKPIPK